MRHSFLKMVVLALVALGFVACGEKKSPIEVETFTESKENMFAPGLMLEYYYVRVRAVTDSITIQKIVVNRGNCGEYTVNSTIKFGETASIKIGDNTDNRNGYCSVKEAQVVTDKGTWTFNW